VNYDQAWMLATGVSILAATLWVHAVDVMLKDLREERRPKPDYERIAELEEEIFGKQ